MKLKPSLPKLPKASQPFTSKSKGPKLSAGSKYPKSAATDVGESITDDADSMIQQKKISARRFGIHAPHASNPKPKGI